MRLPVGEVVELLSLEEFMEAMRHTSSSSSPGPDGVPYSVWTLTGASGAKLIYNLYHQAIREGSVPAEFNELLLVFTPKLSPGMRGGRG